MSVDMVFKVAAVGVLVAVIGQVLARAGREDIAMLTTLAGLIVALVMVVNMISDFFGSVRAIFSLY